MLQKSCWLSQSSPAPCVFVWQHQVTMETGRLQEAGETHTVHCGAAVRAAICLCKPPVLGNSLGAIWGLYSSSAESFWLVLVRDFLFAQHEDTHCVLKKPWFCFGNLHYGIWTLSKDTLVFKFICKVDIKKLVEQPRPVFPQRCSIKTIS